MLKTCFTLPFFSGAKHQLVLIEWTKNVDTCFFTSRLSGRAEECVWSGLPASKDTPWARMGPGSTAFPPAIAASPWTAEPELSLPPSGSAPSEICPGSEWGEDGGGGVGGWRLQFVPLHLAQRQLSVSTVYPGLGSGAEAVVVQRWYQHRGWCCRAHQRWPRKLKMI